MIPHDVLDEEPHHEGMHHVGSHVPHRIQRPLQEIHRIRKGTRQKRRYGVWGGTATHGNRACVEAHGVHVHERNVVVMGKAQRALWVRAIHYNEVEGLLGVKEVLDFCVG